MTHAEKIAALREQEQAAQELLWQARAAEVRARAALEDVCAELTALGVYEVDLPVSS